MNNPDAAPRMSASQLFRVFLVSFKIGLITFGGGMAMLGVIQSEYADKHRWVTADDISDISAVAQSLPGIIAVNCSILTGYRAGGNPAALVAGFACILPSFLVLCLVTLAYTSFVSNPYVRGALRGVSGAVVALFVSTLFKLARKNVKDIWGLILFLAAAALVFIFPSLNVIYIIIGGGVIGYILYYLILSKGGKSLK